MEPITAGTMMVLIIVGFLTVVYAVVLDKILRMTIGRRRAGAFGVGMAIPTVLVAFLLWSIPWA